MPMINREKDVDVIINPLNIGMNDLCHMGTGEDVKENWYFDFNSMKFEEMLDNDEVNEVNSNLVNPESGENFNPTVDSELEKHMDNIFISDKLDKDILIKNDISKEIKITEAEINTESNSTKDVNDNDKVNKVDLDDDLYLFNSHIYWYISPDLPLDLNIIAGHETTAKCESSDYLKVSTRSEL